MSKNKKRTSRPNNQPGGSAHLENPHAWDADGFKAGDNTVGADRPVQPRGKKNLFVDDGSWDGVGFQDGHFLEFPASTIETADRALLSWIRVILSGDTNNLQTMRVLFATGERWALMKQENQFTTQDGVPILPLAALVRNSVQMGKGAGRNSWNASGRIQLKREEVVDATGKRGVRYVDIAPPVAFQTNYTLEFWTRSPIEMNEAISRFVEALRNRGNLETRVADPETGWAYSIKFADSFTLGENLEDYTNAQRIVRSSTEGTLWGIHIRPESARARTLNSFNSLSFEGIAIEDEASNSEAVDALTSRVSGEAPLPIPSPYGGFEHASKGLSSPVKGKTGKYIERPRKRLLDVGRRGERIFIIDD